MPCSFVKTCPFSAEFSLKYQAALPLLVCFLSSTLFPDCDLCNTEDKSRLAAARTSAMDDHHNRPSSMVVVNHLKIGLPHHGWFFVILLSLPTVAVQTYYFVTLLIMSLPNASPCLGNSKDSALVDICPRHEA